MVTRIWHLVVVGIVVTLLSVTVARADDKPRTQQDRERQAKAALALAGTKAKVVPATAKQQSDAAVRMALEVVAGVCRTLADRLTEEGIDETSQCGFRERRAKEALASTCTTGVCPVTVAPEPTAAVAKVEPVQLAPVSLGCSNGQCATPNVAQPARWYPGKVFGRR
jgi:hypothetical protein